MDWTLHEIELKNFKFFYDSFPFPMDGKHILLYGENGSGKSSIVWGLYTLIESRRKPIPEVQKYFDPTHDQHLRNRYSQPRDDSYVKVTFESAIPGNLPKQYEVSATNITTQATGDNFIKLTTAAFDMFNYRMLAEWIYQKNSRNIDLFPGFEKDIFRYLYFNNAYPRIDGTRLPAPDGRTAEEWWTYITSVRLEETKRHQVKRGTREYQRFLSLLSSFKTEMDTVLGQVEHSANDMLHNDLELPSIDIALDMTPVLFNIVKPGYTRSRDGKVHKPSISVKAHVTDPNIPGWSTDVLHLATFFNESKLTCIGIAIRLAISDYKLMTGANVAPVLCIDDLLLSLDMSSRIPIIKLLLKKAQNRQLIIFTHDRAFFETMQMMIRQRRQEGEWNFYEMLERKTNVPGAVPAPMFFKESKSYREKVEYYFEHGDYPAAVNYLRKYCEEQLKRLLPKNLQFVPKSSGEVSFADLSGMIDKLESKFCDLYELLPTDVPVLSVYRKRLMNPLSHDDAHTPVYKAEIQDALGEIDIIRDIADTKKTICTGSGSADDDFQMLVVNGVNSEVIEFSVLEEWTSIEVLGIKRYKDVRIKVTSSTSLRCLIQDYESLRTVFKTICVSLGLTSPPAVPPPIESTITNRHTNLLLSAI